MEETNDGAHRFRLVIPGFHRYVGSTRRFVMSICRLGGVGEEDRDSIGLALTEILNNSIDHGEGSEEHPLELEIEIRPGSVKLAVTETAAGSWDAPDMEQAADDARKSSPDDSQFRGRGLLLVCTLMDEMKVRAAPHGGTIVEVVKHTG